MKFRKIGACALCLTAALTFGLAGCGTGGRQLGEHEKGDRTEITFLCSINTTSQKAWDSLIAAYNDGVGYEEDGVYVTIKNGNGSPSSNYFTQSTDYSCNVIAVNDSQNDNGLQALMISRDSRRAPNGYFLDLTEYAAADEDFQQNTISEQSMNWGRMTYNANAAQGAEESAAAKAADAAPATKYFCCERRWNMKAGNTFPVRVSLLKVRQNGWFIRPAI